ncbi:MAG: pilus assembly PilX N-terminal domain-containing protein [Bacillota bacterium]
MALVLVLIFTGVLLAFGAALITTSVNEKLISGYNTKDITLYYIAEAGIEAGIAAMPADATGLAETSWFDYEKKLSDQVNEGYFTVTFKEIESCLEKGVNLTEIIATGTLEDFSKTMTIIIKFDEEGSTIIEWHKPVPQP